MMIGNYLKVTLRSMLRNRLFSVINVLGLGIGIAATVLIGLFVLDELGYDRQFQDADRIYRVSRDYMTQNLYMAPNAPQAAALLKEDFPGIESAARLFGGQALLGNGENRFYEPDIRFADNELFDIFDFEWIAGDPSKALERPLTIVLTESLARKYFGSTDVLGSSLMLENTAPMEVTGVIRDLPRNTHLDLGVVGSLATVPLIVGEQFVRNWGSNNFHTYIRLRQGADINEIAAGLPAFVDRHIGENASAHTGMTAMAVTNIHLHSTRQFEMKPPGSITNVYMFSLTALFILLIACFNFMNLSTAAATQRLREVGVRKSMGAQRRQLAWQFLAESVLMAALACALAIVLVELLLPWLNGLMGKDLELGLLSGWQLPLVLLAVVAVVGVLAGSYPALYLSGFRPVQVLQRRVAGGGTAFLRNALVVPQFSVAIALVVATLVVFLQLRYVRGIELGFEKDRIVVLSGSPTAGLGQQWDVLRERLLRIPGVEAVTASGQTPLEDNGNARGVSFEGQDNVRSVPIMQVDYDFFSTYGIQLLAGRGFSEAWPGDRLLPGGDEGARTQDYGVVLNELAVRQLGWTPEEAVGKRVKGFANAPNESGGHIIGVVANSNFESIHSPLKPLAFFMPPRFQNGMAGLPEASIRISPDRLSEALAGIDALWREFMPEYPLMRRFLNDDFSGLYRQEDQQASLYRGFAVLAIFIACMGLYGLATFNAERRSKEVGVRKVMGGSVWQIVLLLTRDFSRLVLVANVIAWPLAWVVMQRWLEQFAYRIDLTPMIFIGSGLIALCVAWVTVGGTAARAASRKPVLALRYE